MIYTQILEYKKSCWVLVATAILLFFSNSPWSKIYVAHKTGKDPQFISVQCSRSVMSDSLQPHESQHARPLCPSPMPRVYPLMSIKLVMPSSHLILCHPLLLMPPIPPNIRVFPMSQLSVWGGQYIGVSASKSVLPMNTQDWSPLGWTGWISLQSKGLARVFSNTTVKKHQFFGTQLSL